MHAWRLFILSVAAAVTLPAAGQIRLLDETLQYDAARPAAGHWLGNLSPGRTADTWGALLLEEAPDGTWSGAVTMLTGRMLGSACKAVSVDGRAVEVLLPGPGGIRLSGEISDDGRYYTGTMTFGDADEAEGTFEFARTPRPTDLPRPLAYSGDLVAPQGKLGMTLVFARTPGGNWVGQVDVPMQGLTAFPLVDVESDGKAITARMAIVPLPASIDAKFADDGARLTGNFHQGPFDLAIDFARTEYAEPTMNRPQNPQPPYPYVVREVTITHPDGHTLAGTLTLPSGGGPFPAAVMITGSGPQDRDESLMGHKPFLVIADYLTRHGIAVLRYDDRGTGESTGDFSTATSEDLATDALAAFNFARTVNEIDPQRVGLIGHSEGGIVAPIVGGMTGDVAFMVLLAGTAVPGDEILRVQTALMLRANGATEEFIADLRDQQEAVFDAIRQGVEGEALEAKLRPVLEKQLVAMTGLEGEALEAVLEQQVRQLSSPWMVYFLSYDPRPALKNVTCPVLACNGTLDLQVWHEQNLDLIEQTIRDAGGDVTARRYEGLNHLFQPAETGSLAEYAVIEITVDEQVLHDMAEWINTKVGNRRR